MRQIYTSQRLENIDRVVALLATADIATHITNRSSYDSGGYKRFSYAKREHHDSWPAVWIVRADDQVRARQLLREAGLEPATRYADELAISRRQEQVPKSAASTANRVRLVVLAALAGTIAVLMFRYLGYI